MEIIVRQISQYHEVTIKGANTTMDVGLFDPCEANQLAHDLIIAAEELLSSDHNEDIEKLAEIRNGIGG